MTGKEFLQCVQVATREIVDMFNQWDDIRKQDDCPHCNKTGRCDDHNECGFCDPN